MFAYSLVAIALIAQVYAAQVPLAALAAEASAAVEYKRADYRVTAASGSNDTFLIQDAELSYGKWYLLKCCDEVTPEQINAQKVSSSSVAIFGASGRAFSPTGTTGKFNIKLGNLLLGTAQHDVPYTIGTNTVYFESLSTDPNHSCKEIDRRITSDTVYLALECH